MVSIRIFLLRSFYSTANGDDLLDCTMNALFSKKVVLLRFQSKRDATEKKFCEIAPQITRTGLGNHCKPLKKWKGLSKSTSSQVRTLQAIVMKNCLSKFFGHFCEGNFIQQETVLTYWTAQCIVLQKKLFFFVSKVRRMQRRRSFAKLHLSSSGPGLAIIVNH